MGLGGQKSLGGTWVGKNHWGRQISLGWVKITGVGQKSLGWAKVRVGLVEKKSLGWAKSIGMGKNH